MKSEIDNDTYRYLKIALILSIIIALAFNLFMRQQILQNEGFSELYIEDDQNIPDEMRVGEEYNVTFSFSNHELKPEKYVVVIDSPVMNFTQNITLLDGQTATITISLIPHEKAYNVTTYVDKWEKTVISPINSENEMQHFKLRGFSELHQNFTLDDLKLDPITAVTETHQTDDKRSYDLWQNISYKASGKNVEFGSDTKKIVKQTIRIPFIISLYSVSAQKDDPLEVHFWHEIN